MFFLFVGAGRHARTPPDGAHKPSRQRCYNSNRNDRLIAGRVVPPDREREDHMGDRRSSVADVTGRDRRSSLAGRHDRRSSLAGARDRRSSLAGARDRRSSLAGTRDRRSSQLDGLPQNNAPQKRGGERAEFVKHCNHARERYLRLPDAESRAPLCSTYSSFASLGLQPSQQIDFNRDQDCLLAALSLLATLADPNLLALGPETVSDSGGVHACLSALEFAAEGHADVGARAFTVGVQTTAHPRGKCRRGPDGSLLPAATVPRSILTRRS